MHARHFVSKPCKQHPKLDPERQKMATTTTLATQKKMSFEHSQLDAPILVETFFALFCIASRERNALKYIPHVLLALSLVSSRFTMMTSTILPLDKSVY